MEFYKILNRLNLKQREAVDQVEGPVMVIAGPGSGKTQILSARAGQIMNLSGVDHTNILILTFTNAGVEAMRKRLISFFGVIANEMSIFTFHSLANYIIAGNEHIFGLRNARAADEIDTMQILTDIIDGLPGGHVLRNPSAQYYYIPHLRNLFSVMKQEYLTPGGMKEAVDLYLKDLPVREEFQYKRANKTKGIEVGDLKQAAFDAEVDAMNKLLSAIDLFQMYSQELKDRGLYDFDDMILMVVKAFRENEYFRRYFQEKWLYLMVDEGQDTSGAQFKLLEQLSEFWGPEANVFVVADDDQAIYEFQGARIQNLWDFQKSRPNTKTIVLDTNYRSSQKIIDAGDCLIQNNTLRLSEVLGLEKKMVAGSGKDGVVEILRFPDYYSELEWVVGQIESYPNPNEMAVIYSKHRQVDELIRVLESKGIPYNASRKINVLTNKYVGALVTIMEYLEDPFDKDYLLFEIMNYSFTGVQYKTAIKAALAIKNKEADGFIYFLEQMNNKLFRFISDAREQKDILVFSEYLSKLMVESGLLGYVVKKNDVVGLESLKTFMEWIETYSIGNEDANTYDLMNRIEVMKENDYFLSKESYVQNEKGVHLLTCHGAKGLEFEKVILYDCVKTWEPGRRFGKFKFPDNLSVRNDKGSMEASRRAFFVAMTRAKTDLSITYSEKKGEKEQTSAVFVQELFESIPEKEVSGNAGMDVIIRTMSAPANVFTRHLIAPEKLKEITENFSWSVSALNTYLDCPVRFYFNYILGVPEPTNIHLIYGNAIHHALYSGFLSHHKGIDPLTVDNLYWQFENYMKKNHPKYLNLLSEKARAALSAYFVSKLSTYDFGRFKYAEKRFTSVLESGVAIKGVIDRIDHIHTNAVEVIDYKTGKFYPAKFKPDSHYMNQGFFYMLLLDRFKFDNLHPTSVRFDFVDADTSFVVERDLEQIEAMEKKINAAHASINEFLFEPGCGDSQCPYCNYLQRL